MLYGLRIDSRLKNKLARAIAKKKAESCCELVQSQLFSDTLSEILAPLAGTIDIHRITITPNSCAFKLATKFDAGRGQWGGNHDFLLYFLSGNESDGRQPEGLTARMERAIFEDLADFVTLVQSYCEEAGLKKKVVYTGCCYMRRQKGKK